MFPSLKAGDPGVVGGFRVVARLGEGGMGQVFLALSPGGQAAAVKVIRSEFARDPEFGQRFAREVRAAQKARGAYLASLLGADPGGEPPWLATTYVAGPSLRELAAGCGPLPSRQVLLLAWGIAHALADIHAAEVVHRDLKPDNIMLDETGPKVIDFGVVKSLTQSVTYKSHSTRIGTPLYMSPEQAMGKPVGSPTDVFALGTTLHFLATGREAFAAENEWGVVHRIVSDDPDLSALDPSLRELIVGCLHKDPGQRPTPQRVQELCEEGLGGPPGPGVWMEITGASEAIRKRTGALRTLAGDRPADDSPAGRSSDADAATARADYRPGSGTAGENSRIPTVLRPRPAAPDPQQAGSAVPGGRTVEWRLFGAAAVALVLASFLPIMSESWKDRDSGEPAGHVTEFFHLFHPWTPVSSGIPGVSTDWLVVPVGVIGTAVVLVCGLLAILRLGNADLKGWGQAGTAICNTWFFVAGLMTAFLLAMTFGLWVTDDDPGYSIRSVLMPGAWLLLVANGLVASLLVRVSRRVRETEGTAEGTGQPG